MATILLDVALGQNGQATGNWTIPTLTAGGTVNSLTATITPALTAIPNGFSLSIGSPATNTSPTVTLSLTTGSTTITAPIVKGNNVALIAGDIPSVMELTYSTAYSAFVLQNPASIVLFPSVLAANSGASLIGNANGQTLANNLIFDSIAALRLNTATVASGLKTCSVTAYYGGSAVLLQQPPFQGNYFIKTSDTASVDNGGSIIVDAAGNRWYLSKSPFLSVTQFGAKVDGTTNDAPAINATIAALNPVPTTAPGGLNTGGGSVYMPEGTYGVLGDALGNAIKVPCNITLFGSSEGGTVIKPLGTGTVCVKIYGSYNTVKDIKIYNSGQYNSVSGVRAAPLNEADTTVYSEINYNKIHSVEVQGCYAGMVAMGPPSISGVGTGDCYYNHWFDISIRDCWFGMQLLGVNQYGPNRNVFTNVRIGGTGANGTATPGTSIGLYIDVADTCKFFGCSFEGILSGVGTCIVMNNKVTNGFHVFYSPTFEAYTLAINSGISDWELICPLNYNLSITGTNPALYIDEGYLAHPSAIHTVKNLFASASIGVNTNNPLSFFEVKSPDLKTKATRTVVSNWRSYDADNLRQSLELAMGNAGNYAGFQSFDYSSAPIDLVLQYIGGHVRAGVDNNSNLGTASFRWATVYAATGTINTSDEREKQDIRGLNDQEKAVALKLKSLIKTYRWKQSVEKKGDDARIHIGWIAQDVIEAFKSEGLDAFSYGCCCYDKWDEVSTYENDTIDEEGNIIEKGGKVIISPSGDRYGVRLDQIQTFILTTL